MQALQVIEMLAGYDPSGQPVLERLQVKELPEDKLQLVRSPAFIKGLASGDIIKLGSDRQHFEIVQHSGNLSVVVFSRGDVKALSEVLTPEIEKLGGSLDLETDRMLVYSVHVSLGFKTVEDILNKHTGSGESIWQYGNVYDPADGQTPLNWWLDVLKPQ
ncbi:DUF4265 domain-containing protein [Proteobacteria bacterium 005FR1]|nr:DUF4265 domain-containing protein [Proteobacteria bacterium 005FR1]